MSMAKVIGLGASGGHQTGYKHPSIVGTLLVSTLFLVGGKGFFPSADSDKKLAERSYRNTVQDGYQEETSLERLTFVIDMGILSKREVGMSKWKKHVYRKKVDKHQAFVHGLKLWVRDITIPMQ